MSTTEDLNTQASDMMLYMQYYQLQFFLSRIQDNLNLINSAKSSPVITVVGGNLFQLAAQYYNDATQWVYIAKANNLSDPYITGIKNLIIPPYNNVDSGGILE